MKQTDLSSLLMMKQRLEERADANPELRSRLQDLRRWQADRLARTYADLRQQSRFVPALDFFLNDLYGPGDVTRRDADLKRALTRLQRALPAALLELLRMALHLQVSTMDLDEQMAAALPTGAIDEASYAAAYRQVDCAAERRQQIDLIVQIGQDLGNLVAQSWIGMALRAAHLPAHLAGFGALQSFLERGFTAFGQMGDPRELLAIIDDRETKLMNTLCCGDSSLLPPARSSSQ